MNDSFTRDYLIELFVFIGILLICTVALGFTALYYMDTAPPHAGLNIKDNGAQVSVSVTTMGQSERVLVVVNGTVEGEITEVSDTIVLEKTPDETKSVQIISNTKRSSLLLREMQI